MEAAQAAYDEGQAMLDALNAQYDDIISWADMYDSASTESKKMIVSCLIRRVEVYRDYRLHIDFNIDFEQFSAGPVSYTHLDVYKRQTEYRSAQEEMRQAVAVKANIDHLLGVTDGQRKKEQER